jgi:hypothetical protein
LSIEETRNNREESVEGGKGINKEKREEERKKRRGCREDESRKVAQNRK